MGLRLVACGSLCESTCISNALTFSLPLVPFEGAKPLAAKDTKHKSSTGAAAARINEDNCGVRNTTSRAIRRAHHRLASDYSLKAAKLSWPGERRAVQQSRRDVHECV